MHPVLFEIGKFKAYTYGLLVGLAIITAVLISYDRAKKRNMDADAIIDIGIWGIIGGFIGAKLLYILSVAPEIIKNPSMFWENLTNGFVLYGGIIGGCIGADIYCRKKKLSFWEYFDLAAPAIAVAQGIGRIGCLMAGCCYGKETTCPIGITFKESLSAPNGVRLHPTQIYSSIGDFIIALILFSFAKKERKDGQVSGLYMILYSIGRFFIEFLRDDPRGDIGIFSTSQFICIFVLISGIIIYNKDKIKTTTPPSKDTI